MRKRPTRTTNRYSRHTIQHRDVHVHRHLHHSLEDVFPDNRAELHEKSPSGTRYGKWYHQLPARRNDVGHDRRNEKLQSETTPNIGRGKPDDTATTNNNSQRNSDNYKRTSLRRHSLCRNSTRQLLSSLRQR